MSNPYDKPPGPPRDPDAIRKRAQTHFAASEQRDALVKQEIARERAAVDAKTAKLRALRLAKEEADREAARIAEANKPAPPPKKTRAKKSKA